MKDVTPKDHDMAIRIAKSGVMWWQCTQCGIKASSRNMALPACSRSVPTYGPPYAFDPGNPWG